MSPRWLAPTVAFGFAPAPSCGDSDPNYAISSRKAASASTGRTDRFMPLSLGRMRPVPTPYCQRYSALSPGSRVSLGPRLRGVSRTAQTLGRSAWKGREASSLRIRIALPQM